MRRLSRLLLIGCVAGAGLWAVAACTSVVPEALRGEVDRSVTFPQIVQDAGAYRGRTVLVGGEVVRVETTGADLELTLAERPLSPLDESPMLTLASRGECVVEVPGGARAGIRRGDVVTVVGVVQGRGSPADPQGAPRLQAKSLYLWPMAGIRAPTATLPW